MDVFESYIMTVIPKEGDYSNDPNDPGGPTKFGITEARARAAGYTGDMRDLTMSYAIAAYRLFYWTQPQFDQLCLLSPALALYALDIGINFGPTWPNKFLQRALNVLSKTPPLLTVDGMFGALSRERLAAFLKLRGPEGAGVLLNMMRAQASVRYIEIAEITPSQAEYEYGWQNRRAFAPITVGA